MDIENIFNAPPGGPAGRGTGTEAWVAVAISAVMFGDVASIAETLELSSAVVIGGGTAPSLSVSSYRYRCSNARELNKTRAAPGHAI